MVKLTYDTKCCVRINDTSLHRHWKLRYAFFGLMQGYLSSSGGPPYFRTMCLASRLGPRSPDWYPSRCSASRTST